MLRVLFYVQILIYSIPVTESPLDNSSGSWIALLSGLELSASHPVSPDTELRLQLLIEHILAESGGPNDQKFGSEISRVIIVGNSLLVGEDHLKLVYKH